MWLFYAFVLILVALIHNIHSSSAYRLFLLWVVYYPLCALAFSAIFAMPIALSDDASYMDALRYELGVFSSSVLPLTTWVPSGTILSVIIKNLLALAHQVVLSVFVGISAGPLTEGLYEIDAGPLTTSLDPNGKLLLSRTKIGFFVKSGMFYIIIILVAVLSSIFWGGFLAIAEGWSFFEGFVVALGVITSSSTSLDQQKVIHTNFGIFCGFYVGVFGTATLGLILAIVSAPLLGMDIHYHDSPVVRIFPKLFLSKEQRRQLNLSCRSEARIHRMEEMFHDALDIETDLSDGSMSFEQFDFERYNSLKGYVSEKYHLIHGEGLQRDYGVVDDDVNISDAAIMVTA